MHDLCIMIFQQCTKWSSCLGCSLENDQSKTSFTSMYVRQWMCIRASKESLSWAANTILLATEENSWYFKLSSKTKGHQNRNNAYLYLLQEQNKDPRSTPCDWQEPIIGSRNWLLSSQLDFEYFRSLTSPDKCVTATLHVSQTERF